MIKTVRVANNQLLNKKKYSLKIQKKMDNEKREDEQNDIKKDILNDIGILKKIELLNKKSINNPEIKNTPKRYTSTENSIKSNFEGGKFNKNIVSNNNTNNTNNIKHVNKNVTKLDIATKENKDIKLLKKINSTYKKDIIHRKKLKQSNLQKFNIKNSVKKNFVKRSKKFTRKNIKINISDKHEIDKKIKYSSKIKSGLNKVGKKDLKNLLIKKGLVKSDSSAPVSVLRDIYYNTVGIDNISITKV